MSKIRHLKKMSQSIEILKAEQTNKLVYSSYGMTLNEKRILMLAICKLAMNMSTFPLMYVKISDLKEYLEIEGTSLNTSLKDTCRRLLKRLVEIEDEKGNWIAHQWVSRCKITKSTGILEIKLHDDLKPHLLSLQKHYQSISFEHLAKINKSHAVRLFEILWHKRHESGLPINEIEIELSELHKMLALENKYKRFVDFKKRIIDPSQKELSKSTPIRFSYAVMKFGREVTGIKFSVYQNDDYKAERLPPMTTKMMIELNGVDEQDQQNENRSKLIWKYVSKQLNLKSWHKEYKEWTANGKTFEQIESSTKWAVAEIARKSKTDNPVENPAGFIRWAVRKGEGNQIQGVECCAN